ncbi:Inactive peptidyl-prolyl cis-trans isomerase fkbp6 [Blomia tropicalis]|nr:Inactive peptidyl-prolyl cis-trans isomerase fkbp6 [Blomia tropicalis]
MSDSSNSQQNNHQPPISSNYLTEFDIFEYNALKENHLIEGCSTLNELISERKDIDLEIDLEDNVEMIKDMNGDENADELATREEIKLKEFYSNMLSTPFPQIEGEFGKCIAFKERCQLMKPIVKDKIFKSIIRPGDGRAVAINDAVLFHVNAFIVENYDEPFESTFSRKKPLLCKLNNILKGYALSILTMKGGELSEFAIHSSLAYGVHGCPPRIPPGSDIIAIIEVVDIFNQDNIEYYHSLTSDEQLDELTTDKMIKFAEKDRELGSKLYNEKNYREASFYYGRAIDLLERNSTEKKLEQDLNCLLLTLYHNMTNCQIFLSGSAVVAYARKALRIDPESVKANYQLGKGYISLGRLDLAQIFLDKAFRSRPNDPDIKRELDILEHKLAVEHMDKNMLYKENVEAKTEDNTTKENVQKDFTVKKEKPMKVYIDR